MAWSRTHFSRSRRSNPCFHVRAFMTAHNLPDMTVVADAGTVDEVCNREPRKLAARKALGDGPGTQALVEVLLLHRHLDHGDVLSGITAAAAVGPVSPDVSRSRHVRPPGGAASCRHKCPPPRMPAMSSTSPDDTSPGCLPMTGRCPRLSFMTTCSGRPAHEPSRDRHASHQARGYRAGRHRDRLRHPGAASAHHPRPVRVDRRRRPARAARTCSSAWAPPPPRPATGSATRSAPSWSTSLLRPLTTGSSPAPSPVTAASTFSAWTNSTTSYRLAHARAARTTARVQPAAQCPARQST